MCPVDTRHSGYTRSVIKDPFALSTTKKLNASDVRTSRMLRKWEKLELTHLYYISVDSFQFM